MENEALHELCAIFGPPADETPQRHSRTAINKWTRQENELLEKLVQKAGKEPQWNHIAYHLSSQLGTPLRTNYDVRYHWIRVMDPVYLKGRWSADEDCLLYHLINVHGHNWTDLSRAMKTRSDIQIKYRATKLGL